MHQSYQPLSHGSVFTHIAEGFYAQNLRYLRSNLEMSLLVYHDNFLCSAPYCINSKTM
jgi:hypothetical protein